MKRLTIILLVLSFLLAIGFYPQMPSQISTHWNFQGEADGYMPKFWGLFLIPFITLVIILFLAFIPRLDPLKKNIEHFKRYYNGFIALFAAFMLLIQCMLILWNTGTKVNPNVVISLSLGLIFIYLGSLLKHTKRNWFIGIRTPWTMSSDEVWHKTHQLGGRLFQIAGIISLIGTFFGELAILLIVIPVILTALIAVIYSYVEFKHLNKNKTKRKK